MEDHGAGRVAGGDDAGVFQVEETLAGEGVDGFGVGEGDAGVELEFGVAATPHPVAVGTVGVEVGAGAEVEVLFGVVVVGEAGEFGGGFRELVFEDAELFEGGELVGGAALAGASG